MAEQQEDEADDSLPFALEPQHDIPSRLDPVVLLQTSDDLGTPPHLVGSLVSSPGGTHHSFSSSSASSAVSHHSSLHLPTDSHTLDAAASLLSPNNDNSLLGWPTQSTTTQKLAPRYQQQPAVERSFAFSQLLHQADALPVLPEVDEDGDVLQRTIVPAATSALQSIPTTSLAALAGATFTFTGAASFVVSIDVAADKAHVHQTLAQPERLPDWCDAVPGLVVVVHDAATASNANAWLQATSLQLRPPASCRVYGTSRLVATALGFPTYGRIALLVERDQVGLTLGPFPGKVELVQKYTLQARSATQTTITNHVTVQPTSDHRSCAMLDALERCFLPRVDDYVEQTLQSMARLRFLVEQQGIADSTVHTPLLGGQQP